MQSFDRSGQPKVSYTKEYRTLLEKLLEVNVRLTEVKGDKKLQMKLDPLIDKLIYYFNQQIDKTIFIHKKYDSQWGDTDESNNVSGGRTPKPFDRKEATGKDD